MAAKKPRSTMNNEQIVQEGFFTEIKTVKTQGRITPVKGKMQVCGTMKRSHLPSGIFYSAFFHTFQKSEVCFAYAICDLF